jgi:hypothetical protein
MFGRWGFRSFSPPEPLAREVTLISGVVPRVREEKAEEMLLKYSSQLDLLSPLSVSASPSPST